MQSLKYDHDVVPDLLKRIDSKDVAVNHFLYFSPKRAFDNNIPHAPFSPVPRLR